MLEVLKQEIQSLGKPRWRGLLKHVCMLHEAAIHPPYNSLPYHWEQVTEGIEGTPVVFGHWETVHMALDTVAQEPRHALHQILNLFALQSDEGMLPGPLWMTDQGAKIATGATFPPLWPLVIEEYIHCTQSDEILTTAFQVANKQIGWFHKNRCVDRDGFYYLDAMDRFWESGIIDALRFDARFPGFDEWEEAACVDATSHLYLLLFYAEKWAEILGYERGWLHDRKESVKEYIRSKLYHDESGLFFDRWTCLEGKGGVRVFESLWPVVVGAATHYQADRVINGHLLDPSGFFPRHPLPSVALSEQLHSHCGWHGPSRNSLAYWAAIGCVAYDRKQVAKQILEKAMDQTAKQLEATGAIWESYHPEGLDPSLVFGNSQNLLGHNPLVAMAVLWERI